MLHPAQTNARGSGRFGAAATPRSLQDDGINLTFPQPVDDTSRIRNGTDPPLPSLKVTESTSSSSFQTADTVTMGSVKISKVSSAQELLDAVDRGDPHIEIQSHLDLRTIEALKFRTGNLLGVLGILPSTVQSIRVRSCNDRSCIQALRKLRGSAIVLEYAFPLVIRSTPLIAQLLLELASGFRSRIWVQDLIQIKRWAQHRIVPGAHTVRCTISTQGNGMVGCRETAQTHPTRRGHGIHR